jgi:predicted SAM-dependent methyltransferase
MINRLAGLMPASLKQSLPYRAVRSAFLFRDTDAYRHLRERVRGGQQKRVADYLATHAAPRLHIGCGKNPLDGWLNTDYFPDDPAILHLDATARFPLPDNSVELIFSEHMIEHLPLAGGMSMIDQCFRVLKPGGRLRISTPSMEALIAIYQDPLKPAYAAYIDYHRDHWFTGPLPTPAMIFNDFYRNWGHLTIYDEATLRSLLERSGFVSIEPVPLGESGVEAFRGMENERRMPAGLLKLHTLAFEAEKPR